MTDKTVSACCGAELYWNNGYSTVPSCSKCAKLLPKQSRPPLNPPTETTVARKGR